MLPLVLTVAASLVSPSRFSLSSSQRCAADELRLSGGASATPVRPLPRLGPLHSALLRGALVAALTTAPSPSLAIDEWSYSTLLQQVECDSVASVRFAHDSSRATAVAVDGSAHSVRLFPTATLPAQELNRDLVTALSRGGVVFDVQQTPTQRAIRSALPVAPFLLLMWLSCGAYFQWRFRIMGDPSGTTDRVAEARAEQRLAKWLEASEIPERSDTRDVEDGADSARSRRRR